jgi:hypothetical protein
MAKVRQRFLCVNAERDLGPVKRYGFRRRRDTPTDFLSIGSLPPGLECRLR